MKRRPEFQRVCCLVDEWTLLESCFCWLPVDPEAVVEAVNKSLVTPEALLSVHATGRDPTRTRPPTRRRDPQALSARLLREAVQREREAA